MSILVVDPNPQTAQLIAEQCRETGYKVAVAQTVAEAITQLSSTKVQVLVLEPLLHANDGIELLHSLQSYSDWRTIPIVIYTDDPGIVAQTSALQESGVAAVLYRPLVPMAELTQKVAAFAAQNNAKVR